MRSDVTTPDAFVLAEDPMEFKQPGDRSSPHCISYLGRHPSLRTARSSLGRLRISTHLTRRAAYTEDVGRS